MDVQDGRGVEQGFVVTIFPGAKIRHCCGVHRLYLPARKIAGIKGQFGPRDSDHLPMILLNP